MKALILVPFRAKHDHKVIYAPGEEKEFDNDRAVALAARGLVKLLEETPVDTDDESANATSSKKDNPKASSGKNSGKGRPSKKDKTPTVPETGDKSGLENQASDETAESETGSEPETGSKDNE